MKVYIFIRVIICMLDLGNYLTHTQGQTQYLICYIVYKYILYIYYYIYYYILYQ
jgi:hypothetical protein